MKIGTFTAKVIGNDLMIPFLKYEDPPSFPSPFHTAANKDKDRYAGIPGKNQCRTPWGLRKSWDSPLNESFVKRKVNSYYGLKFEISKELFKIVL